MTVITGTVTKPTKESKVGIAFTQTTSEAPLIIKLIRDESLFATTELRPGLLVLNVCGVDVTGQTAKDAADILRLHEGDVTVVAATVKRGVVATAEKGMAEDPVGVSMKKNAKLGVIVISQIVQGGLFDETGLAKGQVVVAINGNPCPATTKEAIMIIRQTVGKLSIVAEDVPEEEEEESGSEAEITTPMTTILPEGKEETLEGDQVTVSNSDDEANKDPAVDGEAVAKEGDEVKKNGLFENLFSTCLN